MQAAGEDVDEVSARVAHLDQLASLIAERLVMGPGLRWDDT